MMGVTESTLPYYHELMRGDTYEACVKDTFLSGFGSLYGEAEKTIIQELSPIAIHSEILLCISQGRVIQKEIADRAGVSEASCSQYMKRLTDLGIVEEIHPMLRMGKKARFCISDNLLAFWFEVIRKHRSEIAQSIPELLYRVIKDDISTFLGKRFEIAVKDYIISSYAVREIGKWIGTSDGEDTDIDVVAKVYDDHMIVMNLMCECKFKTKAATCADFENLIIKTDDAHCYENIRYMIASWGGFKENLIELAEDRDDLFLVGADKIMGLVPPDPLIGNGVHEGQISLE